MNVPSLVRVVAAVTFAYSTAITFRPRLLAAPARMVGPGGEVPPAAATLIRSIGTRDAALAALLLVDRGPNRATLTAAKAVSDAADTIWFGMLPIPVASRARISGVAAAWSVLEVAAWWTDRRRGR